MKTRHGVLGTRCLRQVFILPQAFVQAFSLAIIVCSQPSWAGRGLLPNPPTISQKDSSSGFNKHRPRLKGRLMMDAAVYRPDRVPLGSGSDLSSARIGISGKMDARWRFRLDYELSDGGHLKAAYVQHKQSSRTVVTVGNDQLPYSLESLTGSSAKTFIERALPNALVPGYRPQLGLDYRRGNLLLSGALFGDSLSARRPAPSTSGNEGGGMAVRAVLTDVGSKSLRYHLGLGILLILPDADGKVRFRARPEIELNTPRFIDTKPIIGVNATTITDIEFAVINGPMSLQAEWVSAILDRDAGDSPHFQGGYVYLSYFLTGGRRHYRARRGVFGPVSRVSDSGACEIALRSSFLDLNGADIRGGREHNATLGFNYYINRSQRLMFNYIQISVDQSASMSRRERPSALTMRLVTTF